MLLSMFCGNGLACGAFDQQTGRLLGYLVGSDYGAEVEHQKASGGKPLEFPPECMPALARSEPLMAAMNSLKSKMSEKYPDAIAGSILNVSVFACVDDVDGITMVRVCAGFGLYQALLTICGAFGGTVLKRTLF